MEKEHQLAVPALDFESAWNKEPECFTNGKKIVLIGGGGHCKSVIDTVKRSRVYSEIVITDCNTPAGSMISGCNVRGDDDLLPGLLLDGFTYAFVTVGSIKDTDKRRELYKKAKALGFIIPSVKDPSAIIADSAKIGSGVFIGKNAVINSDATIGNMAIINTGAAVEHGCRIGRFAHIAVGAAVCGEAEIGDDVFVGANATIIQGVKVGMNSIIGAGSIILRNVPANSIVVGVAGGVKPERVFTHVLKISMEGIYRGRMPWRYFAC